MLRLIKIIADFFISLQSHKRLTGKKNSKPKIAKKQVRESSTITKKELPVQKPIQMDSKYIWLIGPGHGGIDKDGVYQTGGKRAYFKDGKLMDSKKLGTTYCEKNCDFRYCEGEYNRIILAKAGKELDKLNIRYQFTVHPDDSDDVPLKVRSGLINDIDLPNSEKKSISWHSNGVRYSQRSAFGWQVHVYKNPKTGNSSSGSLQMAEVLIEEFVKIYPNKKLRGTQGLVRNNLHMTRVPRCNAILIENFFHTNYKECTELLVVEEEQDKMVSYLVNMIVRFEKGNIEST